MSQESSLIRTSKTIKKALLIFLGVVVLNLTWNYGSKIIAQLQKNVVIPDYSPYLAADNAFGEISLPPIEPQLPIGDKSNIDFTLSGNFGNFENTMKVYTVTKPKETFLTVTRAQQSAQRIGFTQELKNPNDNILKWQGGGRLLTMDKDGLRWNLTSDDSFINTIISKGKDGVKLEDALKDAVNAIAKVNFQFTENFNFSQPTNYFVKVNPNSPYGVDRVEEADSNYMLISFDELLDALPLKTSGKADETIVNLKIPRKSRIYTENPFLGRYYALFLRNYIREDSIISIKFDPIKIDKSGIYKIITPKEAFTRLQEGNGALRALKKNTEETFDTHQALNVLEFNVIAEDTDLGYYVPEKVDNPTYTYPIYIFKGNAKLEGGGNAEFTFYVDALDFN